MDFLNDLFKLTENIHVTGLTKELECLYILNKFNNIDDNVMVFCSSLYECNTYFSALSTYLDDVLLFPMDDFIATMSLATSPDLKVKRLETLKKIKSGKHIVVTNLNGFLKFLPVKSNNNSIIIKINTDFNREKIIDVLESYGYTRDTIVTSTGTYAVRGFIIDIFPTFEDHPIRIEFFGSNIESIKYFNEDTQLSLESINDISIYPFNEVETEIKNSLYDYLDNPVVFYINYELIMASYNKLNEDIITYKEEKSILDTKYMFSLDEINVKREIYFDLSNISKDTIKYNSFEIENYNGNIDLLKQNVNTYLAKGKTVIFCLSKKSQIDRIKEIFDIKVIKDKIYKNAINVYKGTINKGFVIDSLVFISEFDITSGAKGTIKYKNSLHIGKKINSLNGINIGDYVVHRAHGIGVYSGVVTLTQGGFKKDYIRINYLGTDKVYIPVEKIDTIFKYTDSDGVKPKINKLGSTSWELKKRSVQKKIRDISKELMTLYAKRAAIKGDAYKTYEEEDIFASSFPYTETFDQTKAIKDIQNDLKSSVPMDRLLCGDVGFGKTEVAFRAMFKTVLNSKQVLYLCPTTILSKQQYNNAIERFSEYPIEIALLNRFTTPKEVKRILEDLKNNKIDILFGTHRLLSSDVVCKSLGLLVVDEEQRFGVTHKEKIKSFKNDVNVLTLSATPIPRTLKMAMSGLRDLSIIDTPPIDRYPVQTYVLASDDLIVKDAIYKELSRNGQIFILYNKVASIEEFSNRLRKLVPEARIKFAHGKMKKKELDNIMESFIAYEFDILVCTTIIETGIDIQNANTLIIYDADHFGLSQLYQLRGRVGRSNRIAYAYLLYDKRKVLNDVAVKRLEAIKNFTELGSGYKIAMRDLSLRGAGDILGSEQAGFAYSVGLSLYTKMVDEEIRRLKGEKVEEEDEFDNKSLINVDTHINDDYVSDEEIKIEIHRLINEISDEESLNKVKNILIDRFGKITPTLEIYMLEEWFSKLALKLGIKKVNQTQEFIEIIIPEEVSKTFKGDKLFLEVYNINPNFNLKYANKCITLRLNIKKEDKHFLYFIIPVLEKIYEDAYKTS